MVRTKKHYQEKFISLQEATRAAKKQSVSLGVALAVIQSNHIYYVDSNTEPQDWEELLAVYKEGKKVKK